MSRARAASLVLVNWKGVFYYRYQLDRHVTALEGANGAGKTTVMIAAYVVLLPDMSRLRFTNLGETAATGGDRGIWGRLGRPGRPSYSAIDFVLADGKRLVAGVHLERKGEPSVEPTPFLVHGLGDDARLQDLFLVQQGDDEAVPELGELRENAARLGGRLQTCSSARDYFATLFDQGVLPLRLSSESERTKLNDMLRTSMTGGISRALTTELRGFLLKEETGLADTLQRMKANLDACRRTRGEVQESKQLQQEIGAVFEAGQAMFTAAFLASRERATDAERRVQEAEALSRDAAAKAAAAADELAAAEAELQQLEPRRQQHEQQLERARAWASRVEKALAALHELRSCEDVAAVRARTLAAAAASRAEALLLRDRRRDELRRAEAEHRRAAVGLADLQSGIEDLHRRAGAFRQAVRQQREAEQRLGIEHLAVAAIDEQLASAQHRLATADSERRDAAARLADASAHQRQHAEALAALQQIVGHEVAVETAHPTAMQALRNLRELAVLADRAPVLAEQVADARQLAERQARAQTAAEQLGVALAGRPAADVLQAMLQEAEEALRQQTEQERDARLEIAALEQTRADLERRREDLRALQPTWQQLADGATQLGRHLLTEIRSREDLDRARAAIGQQLEATRLVEQQVSQRLERLLAEARQLLAAGGPFPDELLRLRDRLDADLVAASFDEVDPEAAGRIEARLGPLLRALVVDDPAAAARAIADRDPSLVDVSLLARDAELLLEPHGQGQGRDVAERPGGPDVIVQEGQALRVSRIPEHPLLGRKARERRAAQLRSQADDLARELADVQGRRRLIERLVENGDQLLAGQAIWLAGDPAAELEQVQARLGAGDKRIDLLRGTALAHAQAARDLRPRIDQLKRLLPDAHLLDPPDHRARSDALAAEHRAALAAGAERQRMAAAAEVVERLLYVLRTPPLADAEITALTQRAEDLRRQRDQLDAAIDALMYLREHAEALQWSEAPQRLADHEGLVPALKQQVQEAEAAMQAAGQTAETSATAFDQCHAHWQHVHGEHVLAVQQHERAATAFAALEVPAPSDTAVQAAHREVDVAEVQLRQLTDRRDQLLDARGELRKGHSVAQEAAVEAATELATRQREAEPALAAWARLRQRAGDAGVVHGIAPDLPDVRGLPNLIQAANAHKHVLIERLGRAQDGKALVSAFEAQQDTSEAGFADGMLDLWLLVRDWLRRRLPAQVAEVDDPREALLRLADQLQGLEQRLATQEHDLRGQSEDVARGIDVHIRKARGHVTRLNKNLTGVSFGSIEGIRVRLQHVEKMSQVLHALREGAAQALLFQAEMPIEEALDQIFQRFGGGRIGGQRLLDYREYVHLQVEVKRKAGQDWEVANPTRLSTGEAIGVGAALMMVVLTEWERDATLLRGKKVSGSLRFLFLDEANRLSHDNLGVLFDLCRTLDLQLLIAAPEVARAEGNTTYHLVRLTTADGLEEVVVSPRRTRPRP